MAREFSFSKIFLHCSKSKSNLLLSHRDRRLNYIINLQIRESDLFKMLIKPSANSIDNLFKYSRKYLVIIICVIEQCICVYCEMLSLNFFGKC